MKVICPHEGCGQKLSASDQYAGMEVQCPSCEQNVLLPEMEIEAVATRAISGSEQTLANYLQTLGADGVSVVDLEDLSSTTTLAAVDTATRYQMGEELARGGMGAILLALDVNIRRQVAIKRLLNAGEVDTGTVLRFVEEAQVTGQLEHPSIVPVYDLGLDQNGQVYYSMKKIVGDNLRDVLGAIRAKDAHYLETWPLPKLLRVFLQVCDAVAFAHSKGVIHRDLKPENIMLGAYGEVLVLDWGIAKVKGMPDRGFQDEEAFVSSIRHDDGQSELVTLAGSICGSPQYMAPEQAAGQTDQISESTDIFALGAILYEILALRPPYTGSTLYEVLGKAETVQLVDLRQISGVKSAEETFPERPHFADGKIPDSLAAVAMKAMQKSPSLRYRQVAELNTDIEAYLNGFSTSAENAGFVREAVLFVSRNKAICLTVAAALVTLFAGAAVALTMTTAAKNEATSSLAMLREEQKARAAERQTAAPALLKISRDLIRSGDYSEAASVASTVLDYMPDDDSARLQQAVARSMVTGDFDPQPLDRLSTQTDRPELDRLVEQLNSDEPDYSQVAQGFMDLGYPEIAAQFLQNEQERYKAYRQSIQNAYEAAGAGEANYGVMFGATRPLYFYTSGKNAVTDIKPLKGIPFHELSLDGPISDLSPLRGSTSIRKVLLSHAVKITDLESLRDLPIEELRIHGAVPIEDFSALASLRQLKHLQIKPVHFDELQHIRGCPLESLVLPIANHEDIEGTMDISVFRGMPMKKLQLPIYRNEVSNPEVLKTLPLEELDLIVEKPFSSQHIPITRLKRLNLYGSGVDSLSPLIGASLDYLRVAGVSNLDGVEPLGQMRVRELVQEENYSTQGYPVSCLPPMDQLERLKVHGGHPRFFPEPRHFPALESIQINNSLPPLLLTPRLFLSAVFDDAKAMRQELARVQKIIETHPAYTELGPWSTYLQKSVDVYLRDGSGYLGECVIDRQNYGGRYYAFVALPKSAAGISSFSKMVGGHLATITTEEEQDQVLRLLLKRNLGYFRKSNQRSVFLGGRIVDGDVQWLSGEKSEYRKWYEPQKVSRMVDGNWLVAKVALDQPEAARFGGWDQFGAENFLVAIIEWPTERVEEAFQLIPDDYAP